MKLDDYIKMITCISSIIALLNTYSKLGENTKLSEDYFEKVLSVYIKEYKRNKDLNPIKFIKRRFNIGNYFIPSYIFYLIDEGEMEKLHKILIVDHREKFPNKRNRISLGINNISLLLAGIMLFIYYFVLAISVIGMIFTVISIVGNFILSKTMDMEYVRTFKVISLTILISIIFIWCVFDTIIKSDDYNFKIKHIEKVIKRKEKQFNKSKGYYIK